MADQARVTIARTSADDVQQRQVIVSIDDGPKATLLFGDTVTFTVDPGEHVLRTNNTLVWKKTPFSVQPGESVEFAVANRATRFTLGFLSLLGVAPLYLTIERK
ncbi:MAG: hypothetical protein IT184_03790 [Acidobacteria bacterium]|nr:hypothetical protein [Acidobacteriota bacterium]